MQKEVVAAVKSKYGAVAVSNLSSEHEGVKAVAEAFGYTSEELASIPAEANMGLSCGNPTATAHIKEDEVVVDIGSGGGLDVFLAAQKVGKTGKAIGIDMTPEMIDLAKKNAARANDGKGYENVEFHLATIDKLPLEDASVDCVISNCVINLAPDKQAVFNEIARVLKPGGRLAVSDIALKKTLPEELSNDVLAYVGCIAGAIPIDDYKNGLHQAGFSGVEVIDSGKDLNAYAKVENQAGCCSPSMVTDPQPQEACCTPATIEKTAAVSGCCTPNPEAAKTVRSLNVLGADCCAPAPETSTDLHSQMLDLLKKYDVNEYAASVHVFAKK